MHSLLQGRTYIICSQFNLKNYDVPHMNLTKVNVHEILEVSLASFALKASFCMPTQHKNKFSMTPCFT